MMNNISARGAQMITGKDPMPAVPKEEFREIVSGFVQMYSGLTYLNMARGKTLGQSWFDAMKQMETFVATKNEYNPAAKQLAHIINERRAEMSRQMMTNKNKDKVMAIKPGARDGIINNATAQVNNAMATLNKIMEKYRAVADKALASVRALATEKEKYKSTAPQKKNSGNIAVRFNAANQKLSNAAMQQMVMQILQINQRQHQRAA